MILVMATRGPEYASGFETFAKQLGLTEQQYIDFA
jgi:hypothetical protein